MNTRGPKTHRPTPLVGPTGRWRENNAWPGKVSNLTGWKMASRIEWRCIYLPIFMELGIYFIVSYVSLYWYILLPVGHWKHYCDFNGLRVSDRKWVHELVRPRNESNGTTCAHHFLFQEIWSTTQANWFQEQLLRNFRESYCFCLVSRYYHFFAPLRPRKLRM